MDFDDYLANINSSVSSACMTDKTFETWQKDVRVANPPCRH